MKQSKVLFLVLCALLLLVSCYKGDFSVSSVVAQPYVMLSSSDVGLSVYFTGSVPSEEGLTMSVSSPDSIFSWTIVPNKAVVDNVTYYGSSSLRMPSGSSLPTGIWTMKVFYKDGRTLDYSFEVNYRDVQGALERNAAITEAVFDEVSNLTVLP